MDHFAMMSLVAAQFKVDFWQFFDYDIALETCMAISGNSCILSNISISKVSIH